MKISKIIMNSFTACALTLGAVSCKDDFFDVNENPNNPSVSTPKLTLPVAQQAIAALKGTNENYVGNMFMYNWATPSNWSANQEYFRYNITSNFQPTIFENSYGIAFRNLTYVENYTDPTGAVDYTFYKAISKILKAFQYQKLVDFYGDVPYSEANMRGENTTPKYDKAQDIYTANITELTNVIALLDNLPDNAQNPGTQDIIFKGNAQKWQRFANSIKLRYLMRLTNTNQDGYITSEIAKITANGKGFITENVTANPGYADAANQLNPFYGYFRKVSTGAETDRGDYTVATDFIIDFLEDRDDPRLTRLYAEAEKGGYKGVKQSSVLPGTGFTSKDLSKVGPGLIKSPSQPQPLLLLSDNLLMQAEAVVRGYMAGDAETLYNTAIVESFKYLEVPNAATEAAAYYAQPSVSFAASTNKIESIIVQKYIALNGTDGEETWFEYNRTGYPTGIPIPEDAADAGRTVRPYRLLYPASEIARNSQNVPAQTSETAFSTKIFWQR